MRPHHDGSELYVPTPAPALGETVSVFVRVPSGIRASRIHLRWLSDGEPVFTSAVVDRTDASGDVWWRAEMPVGLGRAAPPVHRGRPALAGSAVRLGRLADRRGQHDRPARRRRLDPRGSRAAAPGRARGPAGRPARQEVAAGLLCPLPGTPMIFAGDEIGLTGSNNEEARQPMPWERAGGWDTATMARYQGLIGLRRSSHALRRGGLRWVHADGDNLVFLRESAQQSVLVLARRAAGAPLELTGLPGGIRFENLYGGAEPLYTEPGGSTVIDGYGPTLQVWAIHS